MKVAVEILTGALFYIEVGSDATVADLKREIGALQKLPCDRMILALQGDPSLLMSKEQDDVSLADLGVEDGSHIYLFFGPVDAGSALQHSVFTLPDSHFVMKVAVEILTGALFYVEVGNFDKVADLKREIGAQQNLPCDRMILVLKDDPSLLMSKDQDDVSLADCGVKDGSHIYLFFNPVVDAGSVLQHPVCTSPETLPG